MLTLALAQLVARLQSVLNQARLVPPREQIRWSEDALDKVLAELEWLETACETFDLPMTQLAIGRTLDHLCAANRDEPGQLEVVRAVNGVLSRMCDELSLRFFLYVPSESYALLMDPCPFGEQVQNLFPDAAHDAIEAARCLALQRATATGFHCMRVVEFGLRKLIVESFGDSRFFEDSSTWGRIVNRVRKESNKPDSEIAALWKGKQGRLSHIAMLVNHVGEAFRHPTMHCEKVYTFDEAQDVFQTTGTFMRRLADELHVTT